MASFLRPVALLSLALGVVSSPVASGPGLSKDDPAHQISGSPLLFARGTCKDNLGRCFNPTGIKSTDIASRALATAFCSSFMSLPVVTSTIGTTTPVTVVTVTETVVASTDVVTSVVTSDVDAMSTTQTTSTTYVSAAAPVVTPAKRDVSPAALPHCATGLASSPAAYSSVCSCVGATPSTTYVTATAPVATDTATDYSSITTSTVTVTTSTVTVGTVTEVETSVATLTGSPPAPLCSDAANPYYDDGHYYTVYCDEYYYGAGNLAVATDVENFSDCIQFCANTPGCVYSYWVSPTSFYGDKLYCYAFSEFNAAYLHASTGVDTFSLDS